MNGLEIFPTKLFEFQIDEPRSFNILNEILRNEDEIKMISSTRQPQSTEDYITDYPYNSDSTVIELTTLYDVFQDIKTEFLKFNSSFEVTQYWTAVYVKSGFHSTHNHQSGILDDCNYSGIIYLSDLGGTNFFSISPSSFETKFFSKSKMGKVLIFPSSLPHSVEPTFSEQNKRYIISFNCKIRNI